MPKIERTSYAALLREGTYVIGTRNPGICRRRSHGLFNHRDLFNIGEFLGKPVYGPRGAGIFVSSHSLSGFQEA